MTAANDNLGGRIRHETTAKFYPEPPLIYWLVIGYRVRGMRRNQ